MPNPPTQGRREQWIYVIESLLGGCDDALIIHWLNVHGPNLDKMVGEAEKLRYGQVAT